MGCVSFCCFMNTRFEAIIGLEIHAQIATQSKLFCECSSSAFGSEPNINTCPICMGFPGQLPVINEEAFRKGIKAALALHCEIPAFSKFDRKNYFYPDLPKGFQISQYDQPISKNGWLTVQIGEENKKIRITRLHLEDDAGKLTHITGGTLCDFNRSGIPLMEIVSEPDLRSALEASIYAKAVQTTVRYVGASEADMEKGMMRFDASVSIREKGDNKLYFRAEIKNLNSFKSLEAAINYEIEKQIFLWESGKPLDKNITVGWTDDHQKTYFLRDKEGSDDYRYFPEPDLPPLVVSPDFIDEMKKTIPELPTEKQERYQRDFKLSYSEAILISSDILLAQYYEEVVAECSDYKRAAAFVTTILMSYLNRDGVEVNAIKLKPAMLAKLIKLVNDGKLAMNLAKAEVFEAMYTDGVDPEKYVEQKGFAQISDRKTLEAMCKKIIEENDKSAQDYKNGKKQALQFFVGKVMKETKGQADVAIVQEILTRLLQ